MKKVLISLIHLYQKIPFLSHKSCRFIPTCSNYALESIETYGAWTGSILTLKRLLKCHPLGPYGYDPVPKKEKKNEKI